MSNFEWEKFREMLEQLVESDEVSNQYQTHVDKCLELANERHKEELHQKKQRRAQRARISVSHNSNIDADTNAADKKEDDVLSSIVSQCTTLQYSSELTQEAVKLFMAIKAASPTAFRPAKKTMKWLVLYVVQTYSHFLRGRPRCKTIEDYIKQYAGEEVKAKTVRQYWEYEFLQVLVRNFFQPARK